MSNSVKISFSVKKQEKVELRSNVPISTEEPEDDDEGSKRSVIALENGKVISACQPKKPKREFIIPIRKSDKNSKLIEKLKKLIEDGAATEEDQARLKILMEATSYFNPAEDNQKINFPLSLDERNPESDNEEINPDYEIIPISEFGTAFLRGCGWKEDTGIGKTNQRAIPLKIFEPRPKGLGLGASIPTQNTGTKSNGTINANRDDNIRRKNDEADDEELKPLGRNSYVLLLGGLNKGSYGQVMSIDEENSSVFVKISPSNKIFRVSQFAVQVVTSRTYKRATTSNLDKDNYARKETRIKT